MSGKNGHVRRSVHLLVASCGRVLVQVDEGLLILATAVRELEHWLIRLPFHLRDCVHDPHN